ncbi:MAG: Gfo/Idh/MocA family oxidoreductase [Pirellulaceae bacterium]
MTDRKVNVPRRSFLKTAGAATAGAVASPYLLPSRALGANEKLTFGHIGVGGMGGHHLRDMKSRMDRGEVNIAAVCDIDERRLTNASRTAGPQADVYRDYRYVLERDDIDAVVIATPDHLHALQTVHAAECGKHIYVEKPACCTVAEGRAMIEACNRANVAVQVGSQGRSQPEAYLAHRYLANDNIGKIKRVDCWHYPSPSGATKPNSEPPEHIDWDLWLGPLRWRPFNPGYLHGTFRWIMESGGGQIRDRGAHVMSCAMWWMGADGTGPVTVEATGEAPKRGLWDSAVKINVTYTFKDPDWVLTWNQPGTPIPPEERTGREPGGKISRPGYGALYTGTDGTFHHWGGDGGTWAERKAREWEPGPDAKDVYQSPGHKEDWFAGIKTGRKTIMNVEAGADVAILTVLGNLSFLLGRKLNWDHDKREIVGDEQARRLMDRPQRYPYVI